MNVSVCLCACACVCDQAMTKDKVNRCWLYYRGIVLRFVDSITDISVTPLSRPIHSIFKGVIHMRPIETFNPEYVHISVNSYISAKIFKINGDTDSTDKFLSPAGWINVWQRF